MAPKRPFFDRFLVAAVPENVVKHLVFATWLMSPHAVLGVESLANTNVFARSNAKTTQIPGFLLRHAKNDAKTMVLGHLIAQNEVIFMVFFVFLAAEVLKTMRIPWFSATRWQKKRGH